MPQTTEPTELEKQAAARAESALVQKVAYPAFFEKVAAAGLTPANEKVAQEIVALSDTVCPAVGRALDRYLSAQSNDQLASVKRAADAARSLAGVTVMNREPAGSLVTTYLSDPDVKAAAAGLVEFQLKSANLANLLASSPVPVAKTDEEEEEEKKKMAAPCK